MLLDKRKVSLFTKIGAAILTVTFVISFIPFITTIISGGRQETSSGGVNFSELEQRVKRNPKDAQALIELGNSYFDTRQWDKAIDAYEKALALSPKNVDVRTDLAISYFSIGQVDKAISEAKLATGIDPKHPYAHYNLGIFLSAAGRKEEAAKEWQTFLKLEPTGPQAEYARQQLSLIRKNKGKKNLSK
jgi:cytochrome c-type biogenesis protein CcmH/NrfG